MGAIVDPAELLARPPGSLAVRCDADGVRLRVRGGVGVGHFALLVLAATAEIDGPWLAALAIGAIGTSLLRRRILHLTGDALIVVRGRGPWRRRIAVAWRDLGAVRYEPAVDGVVLERHDGPPLVLPAGAHPRADVRWLAALLDRACRAGARRPPRPRIPALPALGALLRAAPSRP